MYRRKGKQNQFIVVLFVILSIAILTFHFRESETGFIHQSQRLATSLVAPLQTAATQLSTPFRNLWGYLSRIGKLQAENEDLQEEVINLRQKLVGFEVAKKENVRLNKLLGFKEKTDYKMIPARVIGKSASDWEAMLVINRGRADGLTKNMPVVVAEGLVGQVVEVSAHAAKVQLVTDRKSGVAAQLLSTGETGVVEGQVDGKLKLNFVAKNSKVRKGDLVVASGLGGVFPKGLFVATVSKVTQRPYSLYKDISLYSPVRFGGLEEVLVVVNPPPKPPFAVKER